MRFALIGDHGDGLSFAKATAVRGHQLVVWCHDGEARLASARNTRDLEDVLADPEVEACIVAVNVDRRLETTRRVLQSERHALVVHPVDLRPDGAYELNMLQGDTHQVLMPLLPEALTPPETIDANSMLDVAFLDPVEPLLAIDESRRHPAFPGWTLLRRLGGEIVEVSAFAVGEEADVSGNTLVCGRFDSGSLFRVRYGRTLGPRTVTAQMLTPGGGKPVELAADAAAWPRLAELFEGKVRRLADAPRAEPAAGREESSSDPLGWRDEICAAELNDAAARSLAKRRSSLMDYQEASEEVGFKGTMTLVGCGLIWLTMLLLVLSAWQPWLGWLILPAMILFLGLQLLRWLPSDRK